MGCDQEAPIKNRSESEDYRPISISSESRHAAESVIETVIVGGSSAENDIRLLTTSVESDLSKENISLNDEERKAWFHRVKQLFRIGKPDSREHDSPEELPPTVDIRTYMSTFHRLSDLYGLSRKAVKIGAIDSVVIESKAMQDLSSMGIGFLFLDLYNRKEVLPQTMETAAKYIGRTIAPNSDIPTVTPELVAGTVDELTKEGRRYALAILPILAAIPSAIGEVVAKQAFTNEMKSVRRAVNQRVAQSLFMRDFEFVHDKSAAEILNTIEKGKSATVDFFTVTHTEVIPHLASLGMITLGEAVFNPVAAGLQLLRMPFLLRSSKGRVREMLKDREEDLNRKDYIDSRITASIQSLEIVKTTDSMEHAINDLQEFMRERDEFQTTRIRQDIQNAKREELMNIAFDYGIPIVSAGVNWLLKKKGGIGTAAQAGVVAYLANDAVKKNISALSRIYAYNVQPMLQDINRMEELLGPYDELDKPDGERESLRVDAETLTDYTIRINDLSFKDILRHVSIEIPEGTFVTIKGPSGYGKTTLIRHMLGLYGAEKNAVMYGNTDFQGIKKYGEHSIYTTLAYANQNPQFFENMTLRDNLLLWTQKEIPQERVEQTLRDLRLDHLIDRIDSSVKHFSGGELRRIGIARALLKDPKVLFLDEPTANLDEDSAKQVLEIIRNLRLKRPDMTVVAITHDEQFERIAERIVDIRDLNPHQPEPVFIASARPQH